MNNLQKFTFSCIINDPQNREALLSAIENLFTAAPPDKLRDTLIEIYQMYILHEHNTFPIHFSSMAGHMLILLDTLRQIELTVFNPSTETE